MTGTVRQLFYFIVEKDLFFFSLGLLARSVEASLWNLTVAVSSSAIF